MTLARTFCVLTIAACVAACGSESGQDPTPGQTDVPADDADSGVDPTPDVPVEETSPDPGDPEPERDAGGDADAPGPDLEPSETEIGGPDAPDVDPPDVPLPGESFPLTCSQHADCLVACGQGLCKNGQCRFDPPMDACVIANADGETAACVPPGTLQPGSSCLFCNPAAKVMDWTANLVLEGFESGTGTFTTKNLSGSKANWVVSQARAYAGTSSLYFGDAAQRSYGVGQRAWGQAESGPLVIPEGLAPILSFQLWLDTEQTKGFDYVRVLVIANDGHETQVWHSDSIGGTTKGEFLPVNLSLEGFGGQTVRLVFEFDTLDDLINDFEGAYIDAVKLSSGCCATQSDCNDGNPCTIDNCPGSGLQCEHASIETCCVTNAECDDGDVCTEDSCSGVGGTCQATPIAECCHVDQDCDDGDPCTEDSCPEDGGKCQHTPLCCEVDDDCEDADKCTQGACEDGQCVFEFTCCLSDFECDDGQYCTIDQCQDGECVHKAATLPGCCSPEIANLPFEEDEDVAGWTFSPLNGGVGWQVAAMPQAQSAPNVLYYGNPATMSFSTSGSNTGQAVSAPIELPEGYEIQLRFKGYYESEGGTSYDKFELRVQSGDITPFVVAGKSDLTLGSWKTVTKDLTYMAGQTIQLVFWFDSVDGIANDGLGVLIDDLEIISTCEEKTCSSSSNCPSPFKCTAGVCEAGTCTYVDSCCASNDECDDGLVCTNDSCSGGTCVFSEIKGCCESDADCFDGLGCTIDTCSGVGGECSNEPVPGCCESDAECDDDDKCTVDTCDDNVCDYVYVCCSSDAECDDDDDVCTVDMCIDDFCQFNPTPGYGFFTDFETEPIIASNTFTVSPCQWQVAETSQANSGLSTLYYGNLGSGDFNCGQNAGTVKLGPTTLEPGLAYELRWWLYMDTEGGTTYDELQILAEVGGASYLLWTKSQLPSTQTWYEFAVDMSAFAGESVTIVFDFDTNDGIANGGAGVFVDDLRLQSNCKAKTCTVDAECADGISQTSETCTGGQCAYGL